MVEALLNNMGPNDHLDVITTWPNRYVTYSDSAVANLTEREDLPKLTIHRVVLPQHASGMLDQSRSFMVFATQALKLSKQQDYELIIATSSRLMTACLASWIAWRKSTNLYLDIRDIFVDTIQDVLPAKLRRWIVPLLSWLEKKTILQAQKVNLVSAGFLPYFQTRYSRQAYACFTNGIDDEFLTVKLDQDRRPSDPLRGSDLIEILYAGNIGEGQGLHHIIPGLAQALRGRVRFTIIGDGGRSKQLRTAVEQLGVDNVDLVLPMSRSNLIDAYLRADVLFLHLNNYPAFEKVLPSKVFEYAALGKPILAGVSGYPATFISQEVTNAVLFDPCDVAAAVNAFAKLDLRDVPRGGFIEKFRRSNIMDLLAKDMLSIAEKASLT